MAKFRCTCGEALNFDSVYCYLVRGRATAGGSPIDVHETPHHVVWPCEHCGRLHLQDGAAMQTWVPVVDGVAQGDREGPAVRLVRQLLDAEWEQGEDGHYDFVEPAEAGE